MVAIWKIQVLESGETSAAITLREGNEAILGRDPTVDLVIGERSVSRRHCRLRGSVDGVHLKDLGSANGTYMSGKRIGEVLLKEGEEAQIGLARVLISRSTPQTGLIPIHGLGEDSEATSRPPERGVVAGDATVTADGSTASRAILDSN